VVVVVETTRKEGRNDGEGGEDGGKDPFAIM
jgi:hypothetical protein